MIDPWAYAALTLVAVVAGFVDAIAGGGGLIVIPALLFAGVPPLYALGTNKLQSVFGTAVALRNYWRSGLVDWRPNRLTVLVVFVGAVLGALLVQLIRTSLSTSSSRCCWSPPRSSAAVAAHDRRGCASPRDVERLFACRWHDRLLRRFLRARRRHFYTTSLVALRGYGLTRATALTKLVNLSSALSTLLLFAIGGHLLWLLGLCMAAGAMAGGWLGSHSALKFGARLIRSLIVAISLALTAKLLWTYFAA